MSRRKKILLSIGGVSIAWFVVGVIVVAAIDPEPQPDAPAHLEPKTSNSKPKAVEKLEKDVAKALRPHKDIEVKSRKSLTLAEGQWEIVANFVALRVEDKSIEQEMMEAYKKVYTSKAPVDRVALVAHGELVDGYGNEFVAIVYTTEMGGTVGERINWENDWQLTPSRVMTTTYKHPLLR